MEKIIIDFSEKCLILRLEDNIYILESEIEELLKSNRCYTTDVYNPIMIHSDSMYFYHTPHYSHKKIDGKTYVKVIYYDNIDTKKFFSTCLMLKRKNLLPVKIDLQRFLLPVNQPLKLNWSQIVTHPNFTDSALPKLWEAKKIVNQKELINLKTIICRMISNDFKIYSDFCKASFYFNGSYNGGIIYHENSKQYSVHT